MSTGRIQFAEQDGTFVLKFVGEVRLTLCSALDATIERIFTALNFNAIVIDLTETRSIDSTTLGLLAKLSILSRQKVGLLPTVVTTNPDISRLLQSMGFDQVFNIVDRPIPCPECLTDLPSQDQNEDVVRSKVLEAQFRALGAIPQVMAFSEVYQALQTGVVDGQENTPSNIYTQKFHEVQKYTTLTNHGYIGYVVVVNKKFWDDLPADVRGQLEKAMHEATVYSNKIAATENAEGLEEIKKSGKTQIIVPTAAEMAAMRKAMGLTDSLIRLSCGVEDTDDLIADLDRAFHESEK